MHRVPLSHLFNTIIRARSILWAVDSPVLRATKRESASRCWPGVGHRNEQLQQALNLKRPHDDVVGIPLSDEEVDVPKPEAPPPDFEPPGFNGFGLLERQSSCHQLPTSSLGGLDGLDGLDGLNTSGASFEEQDISDAFDDFNESFDDVDVNLSSLAPGDDMQPGLAPKEEEAEQNTLCAVCSLPDRQFGNSARNVRECELCLEKIPLKSQAWQCQHELNSKRVPAPTGDSPPAVPQKSVNTRTKPVMPGKHLYCLAG